jgi:hypothetical protein
MNDKYFDERLRQVIYFLNSIGNEVTFDFRNAAMDVLKQIYVDGAQRKLEMEKIKQAFEAEKLEGK